MTPTRGSLKPVPMYIPELSLVVEFRGKSSDGFDNVRSLHQNVVTHQTVFVKTCTDRRTDKERFLKRFANQMVLF